jgi:hypothetical protein
MHSRRVSQVMQLMSNSELHWMGDVTHRQFYDDPVVIDAAAYKINTYFRQFIY